MIPTFELELGPPAIELGAESLATFTEPSPPQDGPFVGSMFDPGATDSANATPQVTEPITFDQCRFVRAWNRCRCQTSEIWQDYRAFYSWPSLRDLFIGIAAGGVLANTSLDQDFRDWYQERVCTSDLDRIARGWKFYGEGTILIPSYVGLAFLGAMYDDQPWGGPLGEFGSRATRGFLVGAPAVVLGQTVLGAARPAANSDNSHWEPFHSSHGISGHAFVGALPFITAAKMCDEPWLKATCYGLSVLPAWSRVEHDKHYLSQAVLGWWFAYLACRAVDRPSGPDNAYSVAPLISPDLVGVSLTYRL